VKLDPNTFKVSRHRWTKRNFDPTNSKDLAEFNYFKTNNKWEVNCPFDLEWPYLSIPEMIRSKLIDTYLGMMLKNANEKS
jgi:hypothetical protein